MNEKPILHGRDHRPGGEDPIKGFGVVNDWVFAQEPLGTVAANTTVNPSMTGAIVYQTDDGFVYGEGTRTIHTVDMLQVGSYIVRAGASFPTGLTGYVNVNAVIGGDCTTHPFDDFFQFTAMSIPDTTGGTDMGAYGGFTSWAQLCVVNDLSTPTGAYVQFINNSSNSLVGCVGYLWIFRLT